MKVILYFEEGPGAGTIKEMVSDWVTAIADRIGINRDHIAVIGVATDDTYAKASTELFGNSHYTNNDGHTGVGKSATCSSGGHPQHTILFHVCVFGMILGGASEAGSEAIPDWAPEAQLGPYIVAHELGHCRVNELHPSSPIEPLTFPNGFDLELLHDYYFRTFIDEIGACFYADRYYTYELFSHLVGSEREACKPHQVQFEASKSLQDSNRVYTVALHGSSLIWLYLIQLSKIIVSRLGTTFESETLDQPFANLTGMDEFHPEIVRIITDFCNTYPNSTVKVRKEILNIWNEMSLKLGLQFRKLDEGWACHWT